MNNPIIIYCTTYFQTTLDSNSLSSQQSSKLEIPFRLMRREFCVRTNGLSTWQALMFCQRCHHCFRPRKNQIVKLLNTLLSYLACHYIASKAGYRRLWRGFVTGRRHSWLLRESLP